MVSRATQAVGKLSDGDHGYLVDEEDGAITGTVKVGALVLDTPSAATAQNQSIANSALQASSHAPSLASFVTVIVNQAHASGDTTPAGILGRAFQSVQALRGQLTPTQIRDLQAQVAERLRLDGTIAGSQLFSGVTHFGQVEQGIQVQLQDGQVLTVNLNGNVVPFSAASYIDTSTLPTALSRPNLAGSTTIRFQDVVSNLVLPPPAIDFTQSHTFIDPDDPAVVSLLQEIFPPPNGMMGLTEDQIMTAIYNHVVSHFQYQADAQDHWSTAAETILRGGGDCEDLTNLAASLAAAALGPEAAGRVSVAAYLNTNTGVGHTVLNYTDSQGNVHALDLTTGQVIGSVSEAPAPTVSSLYRLYFTYSVNGTVLGDGISQNDLLGFSTASQNTTPPLLRQIEAAMFSGANSFGNLQTNINNYFNNLNTENTNSPYWSYAPASGNTRYRLLNYDRIQTDYQRILMQMQILTTFMSIAYLVADIIEKSAFDMTGVYGEGHSAARKKVQEKFGEYTSKVSETSGQMQDLFVQAIDDYNEAEYREAMEEIEEAHSGMNSACKDIWLADEDKIQKQMEKIAATTAYANIVQTNRRSVTNTRIQMLGAEYLADGSQANNLGGAFNQTGTINQQSARDQIRTNAVFSADGHVDTTAGSSAGYNRFNSGLFANTRQSIQIMNEHRKAWFMVQEILITTIEGAAQELADAAGTGRKVTSGKKVGMAAYSFEQARMNLEQTWLSKVQTYSQTEMSLRNTIKSMEIELHQLQDLGRRILRAFQSIFNAIALVLGIVAAGLAMSGVGAVAAAVVGVIAIVCGFVAGLFGIGESARSRDLANGTAQEAAPDQLNQANYQQLLNAGYGVPALDENAPGLTHAERQLRRNLNAERAAMNDMINLENQMINVGGGRLSINRNSQMQIRIRLQLAQEAIRSWVMVQMLIADAIRTAAADMAGRQKAEWGGKEKDIIEERFGMLSTVMQLVNFDLNQLVWANRTNTRVAETRYQKNVQFRNSFWNLWPGVGQTAGPANAIRENYNYNPYSSGNCNPGALGGSNFGLAAANPYNRQTQPDLYDQWEELNILREASNRDLIATGDSAYGLSGTVIRPGVSDGVAPSAGTTGGNLAGGVDYDFFNQAAKRLADIQMRRFARAFAQSYVASMIMSVAAQVKGRATMSLDSANYAQAAVERHGQLGMESLGYMKMLATDRGELNNMQFNASMEYARSDYNMLFGFMLTSAIGKPLSNIIFSGTHGWAIAPLESNATTLGSVYGSSTQTVYTPTGDGFFESASAAIGNVTEDFRLIGSLYENRSDRRVMYGNSTNGFAGVNMNWENWAATKIAIRNNQLVRTAILRAVETVLAMITDVASALSGGGVAGLPMGVLSNMVKYQQSVSEFQFANIQAKDELINRITNERYSSRRDAVLAGIELVVAIIMFIIQMATLGAGSTATAKTSTKGVESTGQTVAADVAAADGTPTATTVAADAVPAPATTTTTPSAAGPSPSATAAGHASRAKRAVAIIVNVTMALIQDLVRTILHEVFTQKIKEAAQQYRRNGQRAAQFGAEIGVMMGASATPTGAAAIAVGAMEASWYRSLFAAQNANTMTDFWTKIAGNISVFANAIKAALEKLAGQVKKQGGSSAAPKGEWLNNKATELLEKAISAKTPEAFQAAMNDYQRFMRNVMNEKMVGRKNFGAALRHGIVTSATWDADRLSVKVGENVGRGVGKRLVDRAMARVQKRPDTKDYDASAKLNKDMGDGRTLTKVLQDGEPAFPNLEGLSSEAQQAALVAFMKEKTTYAKALKILADEEKGALQASGLRGQLKVAFLNMSGFNTPLSDFFQNYTSSTAGSFVAILASEGNEATRAQVMSQLSALMTGFTDAQINNITKDLAQIMATVSRRETVALRDGGGSAARITGLYAELMRSSDDTIRQLAANVLAADDSSPLGKMELVVKAFTSPPDAHGVTKLDAEGMLRFMEKMPQASVAMRKPGLAWNMLGSTTIYGKLKWAGRGDADIVERVRDAFDQMHAADPVRMGCLMEAAERAKDYETTFRRNQFKTKLKTLLGIPGQFSNWRQLSQEMWGMTGRTGFDKRVLYDHQTLYKSTYSFYGKNAKRLTDKMDAANQKLGIDIDTLIQNPDEIDRYFSALGKTTGTDFSDVAKRAREAMKGDKVLSYDSLSTMAKDHVLGSALADDISMMVYAGAKVPEKHLKDMVAFLSKNGIDLTQNPTFRRRMTELQTGMRFANEGERSASLANCLKRIDEGAQPLPREGAFNPLATIVSDPSTATPGAVGQFGRAGRDMRLMNWNQKARLAGQHLLTEAEGALGRLQQKVGQFGAGMTEEQLRAYRAHSVTGSKVVIKEQGERIQTALAKMLTQLGDPTGAAESAKQIMAASTMPQLQAAITAATSKLDARSAGWVRGAVTDIVRDFQTARFVTQAISVRTGPQSVMRRMMFDTLLDRPEDLMKRSKTLLDSQPDAEAAFDAATGPNSIFGIRDGIGRALAANQFDVDNILALPSVQALAAAGNIKPDRVRAIATGALNGASPEQLGGLGKLEKLLYNTVKDAKVVNDLVTGAYPTAADVLRLADHLNSSPVARHMMGSLQTNSQVRVVRQLIESGHGELTTAVLDSLPPTTRVSVLTQVLGDMETRFDAHQLNELRTGLDAIQHHDPRLLAEVASRQFMPRVLGPLADPTGALVSHLPAKLVTPYTAAFNATGTLAQRPQVLPLHDLGLSPGARVLDDIFDPADLQDRRMAAQTAMGWLADPQTHAGSLRELVQRLGELGDPRPLAVGGQALHNFGNFCVQLSAEQPPSVELRGALGPIAQILNQHNPAQMDHILQNLSQQLQPQDFVDRMIEEMMAATPTGAGALRTALSKAFPPNQAFAAFDPWLNTQPSAIQSLAISSITKEDLMNLGTDAVRERVWTSYQSGLDGLSNLAQDPALARFSDRIRDLQNVTPDQFNLDHVLGFSNVLNDAQGALGPLSPQTAALQSLTTEVDKALTEFGVELVKKGDPFSQDILNRMFTQAPHLTTAIHHAGRGNEGWGQKFAAIALMALTSIVKNFEEAEKDREERQKSGTTDEAADLRLGRLAGTYKFLLDAIRQSPPANLAVPQLLQPHEDRLNRVQDLRLRGEMEALLNTSRAGLAQVQAGLQPYTNELATFNALITDLYNAPATVNRDYYSGALMELDQSPLSPDMKTALSGFLTNRMKAFTTVDSLPVFQQINLGSPVLQGAIQEWVSTATEDDFLAGIQNNDAVLAYAIDHHLDRLAKLPLSGLIPVVQHAIRAEMQDALAKKWIQLAASETGQQQASGLLNMLGCWIANDRGGVSRTCNPEDLRSALSQLIPRANEWSLGAFLRVNVGQNTNLVDELVPQLFRERPRVLDRFFADPDMAVVDQNSILDRLTTLVTQPDAAQLSQLSDATVGLVLKRAWGKRAEHPGAFHKLLEAALQRPEVIAPFVSELPLDNLPMVLDFLGESTKTDESVRKGIYRLLDRMKTDDQFMPLLRQLMADPQIGPQMDPVLNDYPELLLGLSGLVPAIQPEDALLVGKLKDALQNADARERMITAFANTSDPRVLSNFLNVVGGIDEDFARTALTRLALDHPDVMVRLAWSLPKDGDARMDWAANAIQTCLVDPQTNWTVHQQLQLVGVLLGMDTHAFPQTGDYRNAVQQIQNWIVEHAAPSAGTEGAWQRYRPLIEAWQQSGHGKGALRQDLQRIADYMDVFQIQPNRNTLRKTLSDMAKDTRRFQDVIEMVGRSRWAAAPENVSFLSLLANHLQTEGEDRPNHPLQKVLAQVNVLAQVVAARALMLDLQLGTQQLDVALSQLAFGKPIQDLSELTKSLSDHVLKLQGDVKSAHIHKQDASVPHTAYQAFQALQAQVFHQRAAAAVREGSPLARTGTVDEQQRQSDINALARFRSPEELQAINVGVLRQFLSVFHPPLAQPVTPTAKQIIDAVDALPNNVSLSDHILQPTDINLLLPQLAAVPNSGLAIVGTYDPADIPDVMRQKLVCISVLSAMGQPLQNIDYDKLNGADFDGYLRSLNGNKNPADLYLKALKPTNSMVLNEELIERWLTTIMTRPTPISRKAAFEVPEELTKFLSDLYTRDPRAAEEIVVNMGRRMYDPDHLHGSLLKEGKVSLVLMPMTVAFHRVLMALSRKGDMSGSAALQHEVDLHRDYVVERYGSLFAKLPPDGPTRQKQIHTMQKLLDRFVELGDDRLTERILSEFEFHDVHVAHRVRLDAQIANWVTDFSRFITTDGLQYYRPEEMDAEAQLLGGAVGRAYLQLSLTDRQYVAKKLLDKCNAELQKAAKEASGDKATLADKARVQMLLGKFASLVRQTYVNDATLLSSGEQDRSGIQTLVQQAIIAASELPAGSLNDLAIASLGQMLAVSEMDFGQYPGLLERLASRLQVHGLGVLRESLIKEGARRAVQQLDMGLRQVVHRGNASHDVSQVTLAVSKAVSARETDEEILVPLLMQSGDDQVQVLEGLMGSDLRALTRVWQALTQSRDANARRLQGAFLTAVVADPALLKDLFLYMKSDDVARDGLLTVMRQLLTEQKELAAHQAALGAGQAQHPIPVTPLSTAAADYLSGHDRTTFVNTQNLTNGQDVLAKLIRGVFDFALADSQADPLGNEWMTHFLQSLAGVRESTPGLDPVQTRKAISYIFENCPDLFFHPAFNTDTDNYWAKMMSRNFFAPALRAPISPGKKHLGTPLNSMAGATMNGGFPPLLTRLIDEAKKNTDKRNHLFGLIRYVLLEEKQKYLTKNAILFKEQLINELAEHHPAFYLEFLSSSVLKPDKDEPDLLLGVSHELYSESQRDRMAELLLSAPPNTPGLQPGTPTLNLDEEKRAKCLAHLMIGNSADEPLIESRVRRYYDILARILARPNADAEAPDRFVRAVLAMQSILGQEPFQRVVLPKLNLLKADLINRGMSASVEGQWAAVELVHGIPTVNIADPQEVADVLRPTLSFLTSNQKQEAYLNAFLLEYARHQTPAQAEAVLRELRTMTGSPLLPGVGEDVQAAFRQEISHSARMAAYGQSTAVRRSPLDQVIATYKQKLTGLSAIERIERFETFFKQLHETVHRITSPVSVKVPGS